MNTKIKNYVDVLFKDIPNTKKAQELKEEILSTLNDHFEEHIAEGKSENQSYTEALADLGDIDELLKDLEPEKDLKEKIDRFRIKRARNTSIAVSLYILSAIFVIGFGGLGELLNSVNVEVFGVIGVICMFLCIAIATGLIIYTHMSIPQDVEQYISHKNNSKEIQYSGDSKSLRLLAAFMKVYWVFVLIIYLSVSFSTGSWGWTWLIWVIATAIKEAIYIFFNTSNDEIETYNKN
ncbi:MAG: permease prefix domain 1-containing protein [Spirochaetia bacterium]|nr:permease prefix domain 1-containing protein [Spirochaetia bacterium]MDD7269639.1 permease prefix domain 1-containing protein [Treponema sp.]MDY4985542.1 permease prefix domain 1-containing protein [Treponema sp.]